MNCAEVARCVDALASEQHGGVDIPAVLEHLSGCSRCAGRLARLTSLREVLARVYGDAQTPSHLRDRVQSLVEEQKGGVLDSREVS